MILIPNFLVLIVMANANEPIPPFGPLRLLIPTFSKGHDLLGYIDV